MLGETHHAKVARTLGLGGESVCVLKARPEPDVVPDIQPRKKGCGRVLKYHYPIGAGAGYRHGSTLPFRIALEHDAPCGRFLKAGYQIEDRTFPAPARAKEAIEIAAHDLELDVADRS